MEEKGKRAKRMDREGGRKELKKIRKVDEKGEGGIERGKWGKEKTKE